MHSAAAVVRRDRGMLAAVASAVKPESWLIGTSYRHLTTLPSGELPPAQGLLEPVVPRGERCLLLVAHAGPGGPPAPAAAVERPIHTEPRCPRHPHHPQDRLSETGLLQGW
jgi:hypothetical protein